MMPALTVANLLAWSIQVTAVVLLGGVALQAARLPSPRVRLACFRLLLAACLLLPFLPAAATTGQAGQPAGPAASRSARHLDGGVVPTDSVDVTPASASRAGAAPAPPPATWLRERAVSVVLLVVAVGAVARLVWLLVGLLALRRLRRDAVTTNPVGAELASAPAPAAIIDRAIDLAGATADVFTSRAVKHPVTFGLRRPVILLPESYASLDDSEQVAVVCHELLHVRRHDWLQIVAEELLRAVFWFQPAIWWLLARIDLSREQLVDQEVVALTERRRPYVKALVTLAMDPAGPVLRPASLFLGRAHLLQRVALLSREVRMSRPRLVVSLALVLAVLVVGGRFVVHAFPLTAAASPSPISPLAISGPSLPAPAIAFRGEPPLPTVPVPAAAPVGASAAAQTQLQTQKRYPEALTRAEPVIAGPLAPPGTDLILAAEITVQPAGDAIVNGTVEMIAIQPTQTSGGEPGRHRVTARAVNADTFQHVVADDFYEKSGAGYMAAGARATFDALRAWRFGATEQPFKTVIGLNLARGEQSGGESAPIRVGGGMPVPVRIRNVQPVYPQEAQDKGIQGVVIMELVIDGAGIPISAYVLRPVEGLSMAAVQAALQWRYQPDASYTRKLMTVTVNFTLGGVTGGIVAGAGNPPPPPPPGGVQGGVAGGVPGGIAGGVQGGVAGGVPGGIAGGVTGGGEIGRQMGPESFGPPRSEWAGAIRVGGNVAAPTRIKNVNPVYPRAALDAKVQGVVIVEILIGPDGTVQAGQILRSIPLLDQAALDAVKQWQFTPTLLNGAPVSVIMTVTCNFTVQ